MIIIQTSNTAKVLLSFKTQDLKLSYIAIWYLSNFFQFLGSFLISFLPLIVDCFFFLFFWGGGLCLFVGLLVFWDSISLCSPGYSRTGIVCQAGLELGDLPVSASWALGLKIYTPPGQQLIISSTHFCFIFFCSLKFVFISYHRI